MAKFIKIAHIRVVIAGVLLALFAPKADHVSAAVTKALHPLQPISRCAVDAGNNMGIIVQTCGGALRPIPKSPSGGPEPIELPDGTFLHQVLFHAPTKNRFTLTVCGSEVLEVS